MKNSESQGQQAHREFVSLLEPVLGIAYGVALRLAQNAADAEDLVQEASLRAFANFHTFQPGTHFKAWFLTILTNCFNMRWRKKKRQPATIDLDDAPPLYMMRNAFAEGLFDVTPDPAAEILSRLDAERVSQAVRSVPEEYRLVCTLYFLEDLSYQEIAAIVGCPLGTVRSRLHRGRRMLQKTLWKFAKEDGIVAGLQPEPTP